jgi:hypothetical protein
MFIAIIDRLGGRDARHHTGSHVHVDSSLVVVVVVDDGAPDVRRAEDR